jgi:hypothetical protein
MKKTTRRTAVRKARIAPRETRGVASQPLRDRADRLAAGTEPSSYASAAPATGTRPDVGGLPIVDAPTDGSRRHEPIRWQVPYGWNAFWTPRRTALTPFSILRGLADTCDHVRLCIETRKDQLCSLEWDIAPKDKKSQKGALSGKIDAARTFFRKPDKKRSFSTWLRMAIEEVLVLDALSIFRRKTYGGELYALQLIDGATILPLLDPDTGDIPDAPNVAYRQIIYGRPIEGGDCSVDDLYYVPRTARTHTPYGLSPTEAVLLSINAILNRQMFNLAYYTEGNIPEGLLEAPEGASADQLAELQEYLDDYLSGDLSRRRRLKMVHSGGSKVFQFKTPDFTGTYDEFLLKLVCAAFAVPPSEVGFTADVNKATSQGQENVVYRRGVKPLSRYFKDIFDDVLALDLELPDLQFIWSGGEVEDNLKLAQADKIYVDLGVSSVDEIRMRNGDEPIGLGHTIATLQGPMLVSEFLNPPDPEPAPAAVPPGEGKLPASPADTTEPPATKLADAILVDLRKWRAIAIKDAKGSKTPRTFQAAALPVDLQELVERFLAVAGTDVAKIVAAFDMAAVQYASVAKAGEARTLTRIEQKTAKAYRKVMANHFSVEGAALLTHLRKGLA